MTTETKGKQTNGLWRNASKELKVEMSVEPTHPSMCCSVLNRITNEKKIHGSLSTWTYPQNYFDSEYSIFFFFFREGVGAIADWPFFGGTAGSGKLKKKMAIQLLIIFIKSFFMNIILRFVNICRDEHFVFWNKTKWNNNF